jgi:hypothetical protein
MLLRIARCLAGYVLACLVAGIVAIAFVIPPSELVTGSTERLNTVGIWMLLTAVHTAVFAAPFALVGLIYAERKSIRQAGYYIAFGWAVAAVAFLIQLLPLGAGQPFKVTAYVVAAVLSAAVAGSFTYWLVAGCRAGDANTKPLKALSIKR